MAFLADPSTWRAGDKDGKRTMRSKDSSRHAMQTGAGPRQETLQATRRRFPCWAGLWYLRAWSLRKSISWSTGGEVCRPGGRRQSARPAPRTGCTADIAGHIHRTYWQQEKAKHIGHGQRVCPGQRCSQDGYGHHQKPQRNRPDSCRSDFYIDWYPQPIGEVCP